MLKELEMDKAAGRYVVWLSFPAFEWNFNGKEHVKKFMHGKRTSSSSHFY